MNHTFNFRPKAVVFDVDGVMTTGQFIYSENGKAFKIFGAHDNDGLKMLQPYVAILFVTADKRGFNISYKRIVEDMKQELVLVGETERSDYLESRFGLANIIYMGDGIYDAPILQKCGYGIAPHNARKEAISSAKFITESNSGNGAVLDACIQIIKTFFSDSKQ